jgi:hypothetical protein
MRRLRRSCLFLAWVLVGSAAPVAAQAAPDSARDARDVQSGEDTVDKARQLFTEGLQFVEDEDWAQAEERFRRVLLLKSSHVVSYNLASALQHLGRVTESSELLRVILRDPSADAATHDAAQQLLSEIEPLIGSITIRVSGDTSDAVLSLDDRRLELSSLVQTVSVDSGQHHVAIKRESAPNVDRDVIVGGAYPLQAEVAIELSRRVSPQAVAVQAERRETTAPVAATAATRDEAPSERDSGSSGSVLTSWWLWAGVGAVVAAGVITAVLVVPSSAEAKPVAGDPVIRGIVMEMP